MLWPFLGTDNKKIVADMTVDSLLNNIMYYRDPEFACLSSLPCFIHPLLLSTYLLP
jgi:hypothetical protein